MLKALLLLFVAGGVGTLIRYSLTRGLMALGLSAADAAPSLPATLVVNAVGCLAAGYCWGAFEVRDALDSQWRVVVMVGLLGAWTTFSAYALEAVLVAEGGAWIRAVAYVATTNVVGLVCLVGGVAWARATLTAA